MKGLFLLQLRLLLRLGYPGTTIPREADGAGLDHLSLGIIVEEMAPALGFVSPHVVTRQVAMLGTDEQRRRYLPALLNVDRLGAAAISEPEVGSDAGSVRTTARPEGDRYVLDGTKAWLILGSVADLATVLVSTDPPKGSRGLSRLIVELDHDRLEVATVATLGDRLAPFAEITFRNYRVPVENRLGGEGEGLRMTLKAIQASRASMASHAVGLAQAAVDAAIAYAKERRQSDRPIGGFQLVQGMLLLAPALFLGCKAGDGEQRGQGAQARPAIQRTCPATGIERVVLRTILAADARVVTAPDGAPITVSGQPSGGAKGYHPSQPGWKETPADEWGLDFACQQFGSTLVVSSKNEIQYIHHSYLIQDIAITVPDAVRVLLEPRT